MDVCILEKGRGRMVSITETKCMEAPTVRLTGLFETKAGSDGDQTFS